MLQQFGSKALSGVVLFTMLVLFSSAPLTPRLEGQSRDGVVLTRNLPPTVDLAKKRIAVEINTTGNVPVQYLDTLKTRLTTGIQSDPRFIIDTTNPETTVRLTATRLAVTHGTTPMTIKGQQTDVMRAAGDLQVSFQVLDAITKVPRDSRNLQSVVQRNVYQLRRPGPLGGLIGEVSRMLQPALSDQQVFDILVNQLMAQVIRRMAQTEESINVGLPTDELEKFRGKAQAREWISLYDDLLDMKTPKDDDDKAQREFWMGVAKEAEGYESKDSAHARQVLVEASGHYEKAFDLKPNEDKYLSSKYRAEESTILLAGATPNEPDPSGSRSVAANGGGNAADEVMTNEVVIYLLNSKMSPDVVVGIIKDTKTTKFDVSFAALGRLSSSNVPDLVIQAMREKAKGQ